jgi:hypothetical protein
MDDQFKPFRQERLAAMVVRIGRARPERSAKELQSSRS